MSSTLPDQYRSVDKTDEVTIRRNPDGGFDPEPSTLCKVGATAVAISVVGI